ncbi:ATP-binding protein [Kitasatospora sp. NPDC096147]|uniref:ATP-binding protein n=1 Tax=Kitasatospora sp. NPDC096147 TaxID=3364093 RepID=UPI003816CEBD
MAATDTLPAEVSSFVGRRRELTAVREALAATRCLTLHGIGGVGKTRLALRATADLRRAFPDGTWFVELAETADGALLAQTVAERLNLNDPSGRPPEAVLTRYLETRHALLVLDNCEHLLDACAALVDTLLRAAPALRVLTTSRTVLGIDGERVLEVRPLSLPDPTGTGTPTGSDAVDLFVERAGDVSPGFRLDDANTAAVAELCRRLDGLPLSLELAARRLRVLTVPQVLGRLDDRYRLLVGGSPAARPRQQTLRALVDWSHDLCSPPERLLWARLSVFPGGFDLDAAEAVCSGDGLAVDEVLDLLGGLLAQSVLTVDRSGPRARYRMLETLRQYGRHRLADAPAAAERVALRHLDWCLELAATARADWFGEQQAEVFTRLRACHPSLRAALELCATRPDRTTDGLTLASLLAYHWIATGFLSEGRHWLARLLAADDSAGPPRALALCTAARLAALQGDGPSAAALLAEGSTLAERLADPPALAQARYAAGLAALTDDDLPRARALLREAFALQEEAADDPAGLVTTGIHLASVEARLGTGERAAALHERCLRMCTERREGWFRSWALWARGVEVLRDGAPARAELLVREALQLRRAFDDRLGVGLCVAALAWTAVAQGRPGAGARLLGAAEAVQESASSHLFDHLREDRRRSVDLARQQLGDTAFDRAVAEGRTLGYERTVALALDEPEPPAPAATARPGRSGPLTRRETEVAELVADGLSNREIAERLVISTRTVESHVEHVLAKLAFTSRAQIATWITERRTGTSSDSGGGTGRH